MKNRNLSTRDICLIGIFTAIISVLAQISVPMPYGVPMTLQTFAIPLVGIILGAKKGTLATVIYVLLGTIGIPVFTGFSGGIGIVFGATGGFILSFPIIALTAGIGVTKSSKAWLIFWLTIGSTINYLCGMLMFSFVTSSDLSTAFAACVLPFIPTAIMKIILACVLGIKIKNTIDKAGVAI